MKSNIKLNVQYVTDVIGEEYKKWRSGDVVKIKTQTGSGKTYFIKNSLIPYIDELNALKIFNDFKVLILTNRINLSRQIKKDLLIKYKEKIPKKLEDIDKHKQINNVTIMSYQGLNEIISNDSDFNLNYYNYVICDEIQYLFDDSWNGRVYEVLNCLINQKCENTIKIFMSATMEQLDNVINKCDKNNLWEYDTDRDYSYLKPYTYNKIEQLIREIINDKTKNKWIIFISNIEKGKELLKQLQKNRINSVMIYRGCKHKKSKEELNNIVMNEKFNSKVLITTKILDNGINITDKDVKNIVVNSWNKINLIQSIGRVRFKNIKEAYEINLYLDVKTRKQFSAKAQSIDKTLKHFELLIADKNEFNKKFRNKLNQLPNGIHLDKNNQFTFDKITYANLLKSKLELSKIKDDFSSELYINKQLGWLGLDKDIVDLNEIQQKQETDEIEEYIKSLIDKPLDKEQQNELINTLNLKDYRNRLQRSYSAVNGYLQGEHNLYIETVRRKVNNKRITLWIIRNQEAIYLE